MTKIIKNTWSASIDEAKTSNETLINFSDNVEKFFIGLKEIKNFSIIKTNNNEFQVIYGLKKNCARNYYVSLSDSSFLIKDKNLICLRDENWANYEKQILNEKTIKLK